MSVPRIRQKPDSCKMVVGFQRAKPFGSAGKRGGVIGRTDIAMET